MDYSKCTECEEEFRDQQIVFAVLSVEYSYKEQGMKTGQKIGLRNQLCKKCVIQLVSSEDIKNKMIY